MKWAICHYKEIEQRWDLHYMTVSHYMFLFKLNDLEKTKSRRCKFNT